jgi:hypothetical protein
MLLFDGMGGRNKVVVGFSFWVVGEKAPAGFAGPNDQWHRHHGLCFSKEGWLLADGSPTRSSCKELWMGGKQLWMLHAWVVPGWKTRGASSPPPTPTCARRSPRWGISSPATSTSPAGSTR